MTTNELMPSHVVRDDYEAWYLGEHLHRVDGPALIDASTESEAWYFNGLLHRVDGPARTYFDIGAQEWWQNGKLHRADGPAVTHADGGAEWWENDMRHREDGPAQICPDGRAEWWVDGWRHREDGPAFDVKDELGWYLFGVPASQQEAEIFHKEIIKMSAGSEQDAKIPYSVLKEIFFSM